MGVDKGVGQTQVVRKELRKAESSAQVWRGSRCESVARRSAYYPDFAYRLDGRRKRLQVLSVVGPSKFVQGKDVEAVSCFNRLQAEGDATCIEEYGKRLGYVYSNVPSSTIFFTAMFKYVYGGGNVKWVNPLPFDAGAEDLVFSLARDAQPWIDFFQRNISKLKDSPTHTMLSLVLQLDVIDCEAFSAARMKMPLEVRFAFGSESQGVAKKQKGVRFRSDRAKWVAEFNPPGKKNNKISLGEYDTVAEAARAADAGMFCYGSRMSGYNFPDSPSVLQRGPRPPVRVEDKEAVRRWARDFAKLTAAPSRPAPAPQPAVAISLPPLPVYDSDSSSAATLHLEDVTEFMDMTDQAMLDQRAVQINGSLPQSEMSYPEEALFRPSDVDFWNPCSPMFGPEGIPRTASDMNSMVTDELFQSIMSCSPPCSSEVERCNVCYIR